jgi:beta-glucosidase
MPGANYFGNSLVTAVQACYCRLAVNSQSSILLLFRVLQNGQVPQSVLDDKALRVLTSMYAAGIFDAPPCPGCNMDANVTTDAHAALARTLAAAGTVLLQNTGGLLPIAAPRVRSILVVGDDADADPYCCGAGSGGLSPPYVVTPLAGITARAGAGIAVTYFPTPVAAAPLTQWYSAGRGDHFLDFQCTACPSPGPDAYTALRVEAYASATACGGCLELGLWWNVANLSNLIAPMGYPAPPGYAYQRPLAWALPLNYSGEGETAVLELWRGYDTPTGQPPRSHLDYFTLATNASRAEAVAAGYTKLADIGRVFVSSTQPDYQALQRAAAAADVVVVCVSVPSSEGTDRASLNLTSPDDAMIAAVLGVQPATVVVLNNPGAIVMPWRASAGAIVSAWYPGQEMGNALADVLFGDVNPSGRLPLTFPVSNADTPMQTPQQYPGVDGTVTYSEKLNIGYRWWQSQGLKPAFPFGHGLSYTTFQYSGLSIYPGSCSGNGCVVNVTFTVINSGGVAGREVPQLYVGFPASAGEPPSQLRGFQVVSLTPGDSEAVTFTLVPRDLSTWDVDGYKWALAAGSFGIFVGASSEDIRMMGSLAVSP